MFTDGADIQISHYGSYAAPRKFSFMLLTTCDIADGPALPRGFHDIDLPSGRHSAAQRLTLAGVATKKFTNAGNLS